MNLNYHTACCFILTIYLTSIVSCQYLYNLAGRHRRRNQGSRRRATISEGRVRLVGGSSQHEGNVEIYHLGRWGSICDDEWDEKEASVICTSLGYSKHAAIPTSNSQFGKGRKLIWMDNLYCNGNETRIDQCQFDGWKIHDCVTIEAAGVIWYTVCGNGWSLLEAMVVCRSLGLGYGQFASIGEFTSNQSLPIFPSVNCKGYEKSVDQCKVRDKYVPATCDQSNKNIAGVMCIKELPDLAPDEKEFGSSVYLEDRPLALLQCALEENCLSSDAYAIDRRGSEWLFQTRRLLRFTARIGNIGTADFIPFLPKQEWEWHSCHRHYHSMEVFAHFDLLDLNGKRIAEGHKASFCLEDNNCSPGSTIKYSCKNMGTQGISVGCVDTYLSNIDCQWIDITHLNPGLYQLKLSINPEFKVSELSFDNNAALCYLYYDSSSTKVWNCTLTRP